MTVYKTRSTVRLFTTHTNTQPIIKHLIISHLQRKLEYVPEFYKFRIANIPNNFFYSTTFSECMWIHHIYVNFDENLRIFNVIARFHQ